MGSKTKNNMIPFLMFLAIVLSLVFVQTKNHFNFAGSGFGGGTVLAADSADEVKDDIKDLEKKKKEEQEKLERYEGDVSRLQGEVNSTQKDINTTEAKIDSVEENIERKEEDIKSLNKNIEFKKLTLKRMLQKLYYNSEQPLLYLLLKKDSFLESAVSTDNLLSLKKKTLSVLDEINQSKEEVESDQKELEEEKEKHEDLLGIKEAQKNSLVSEKQEFQQKVEKKKLSVAQINKKISKLKSTLSSFLGKSFDAKDIVDAIKYASKKTGVRKEFLMAMLDKESDLGRFTGGCTYKNTKVKSADKTEFKKICEELGYNYKKQKISCAASWGGYGGAMGVAQFMPTTWVGYKSSIASYTGHNPPDPWNLTDGVVGMAEKLKRAGAASKKKEHYAAKVYYCGGPSSAYWKTKCEDYADTVIDWSDGYDDYF